MQSKVTNDCKSRHVHTLARTQLKGYPFPANCSKASRYLGYLCKLLTKITNPKLVGTWGIFEEQVEGVSSELWMKGSKEGEV